MKVIFFRDLSGWSTSCEEWQNSSSAFLRLGSLAASPKTPNSAETKESVPSVRTCGTLPSRLHIHLPRPFVYAPSLIQAHPTP